MSYRLKRIREDGWIMVVGCGGTGGFLAEGLCRLLIGTKYRLALVDHDRVEKHNLGRQNFYKSDLGRFKAQVLAERLSALYGREVDYLISPIEQLYVGERGQLTIGCVDNPAARERLQYAGEQSMMHTKYSYQHFGGWYIDAGNGEHSGQVLIGNALLKELQHSFYPDEGGGGVCHKLPLPTIQQPGLLAPQPKPVRRRDCAEAVRDNNQSPVINQAIAALVLQFVYRLLKGELTWMGAYLDLEAGTLSMAPADPETVARMTGMGKALVYHPRAVKERIQVRV